MRSTLVGPAWLESEERVRWEERRMGRGAWFYAVVTPALRWLARRNPDGPDLSVIWVERLGPGGETFLMPKLKTMRDAQPGDDLRAVTTFWTRLARVLSIDERPQIDHELEQRAAGFPPQLRLVDPRPLNRNSHELMDAAMVAGVMPWKLWSGWYAAKSPSLGGVWSETYLRVALLPGREDNPRYLVGRGEGDVWWKENASLEAERRVMRLSRRLRARLLGAFLVTEARWAMSERGLCAPPRTAWYERAPALPTVVTREAVLTVAKVGRKEVAAPALTPEELAHPRTSVQRSVLAAAAAGSVQALPLGLPPGLPQVRIPATRRVSASLGPKVTPGVERSR